MPEYARKRRQSSIPPNYLGFPMAQAGNEGVSVPVSVSVGDERSSQLRRSIKVCGHSPLGNGSCRFATSADTDTDTDTSSDAA